MSCAILRQLLLDFGAFQQQRAEVQASMQSVMKLMVTQELKKGGMPKELFELLEVIPLPHAADYKKCLSWASPPGRLGRKCFLSHTRAEMDCKSGSLQLAGSLIPSVFKVAQVSLVVNSRKRCCWQMF